MHSRTAYLGLGTTGWVSSIGLAGEWSRREVAQGKSNISLRHSKLNRFFRNPTEFYSMSYDARCEI